MSTHQEIAIEDPQERRPGQCLGEQRQHPGRGPLPWVDLTLDEALRQGRLDAREEVPGDEGRLAQAVAIVIVQAGSEVAGDGDEEPEDVLGRGYVEEHDAGDVGQLAGEADAGLEDGEAVGAVQDHLVSKARSARTP